MKALCDGIEALWAGAGGASARALANGLFYQRSPSRVEPPFVRYHIISDALDWVFGPGERRWVTVQFSVFSKSQERTEAETLLAAVTALYDWAALSVSGWSCIVVLREAQGEEGAEGEWHCWTRYRVRAQKS